MAKMLAGIVLLSKVNRGSAIVEMAPREGANGCRSLIQFDGYHDKSSDVSRYRGLTC